MVMNISWRPDRRFVSEAIRFGIVGVKNNIVYYFLYVALSLLGVTHGWAVTVIYIFGIFYSFLFNKRFVFKDRRQSPSVFARYMLIYVLAWGLNLILLQILTTVVGLNHYLVQALLILVISGILFVALRSFVFRPHAAD